MTEWRPIPGYEGYYDAGSDGRIRRVRRYHNTTPDGVLRPGRTRLGYLSYRLSRENKPRWYLGHRLVAFAFLERPEGAAWQINHIDGDKANNAVSNLEWVTARQNMRHAQDAGLRKNIKIPNLKGERHPNAKLTVDEVRLIRALRPTSSIRKLAAQFGVSARAISFIITGQNWPDA